MLPTSNGTNDYDGDDYDGWSDSASISDNGGSSSSIEPPARDETAEFKQLLGLLLGRCRQEAFQEPSGPTWSHFQTLGKLIFDGPEIAAWFASGRNDSFVLSLPRGLHNPLVVSGVVASFRKFLAGDSVETHFASVRPGPDLPMGYQSSEFMLASLCNQWTDTAYPGWFAVDTVKELGTILQDYTHDSRERVLHSFFDVVVTSGFNHRLILVVDLTRRYHNTQSLQRCLSTIKTMLGKIEGLDSIIKILVVLDEDDTVFWSTSHKMTVSLDSDRVQESLVTDLMTYVDSDSERLSRLDAWDAETREDLRRTVCEHIRQPMLVFSYIQHLEARPWISKAQLRANADKDLLSQPISSPTSLFFSKLSLVKPYDRDMVANVLGFLHVCGRPMTTKEMQIALAMARLPPNSDNFDDERLLDLESDIRQFLAGIVRIEDGQMQLLSQFWNDACCQDTNEPALYDQPGFSWLCSPLESNKKLALACLRYMSLCSLRQTDEERNDTLSQNWPFLEYAVAFWNYHFSLAYQKDVQDEDAIRQFFSQNPEILRTWLAFQDYFIRAGLSDTKKQDTEGNMGQPPPARFSDFPSALDMEIRFHVSFPEAIEIAARGARIATVMGGDIATASVWSAWVTCQSHGGASDARDLAWLKQMCSGKALDFQSLLRALPYAIKPTFRLLCLSAPKSWPSHAADILRTAIGQGATAVAGSCLDVLNDELDFSFVSGLSLGERLFLGSAPILERLFVHWQTPSEVAVGNAEDNFEEEMTLIFRSAKFGNRGLFEKVLAWLLQFSTDVLDTDKILSQTVSAGRSGYLEYLLQKMPDLVKHSSTERLSSTVELVFLYRNLPMLSLLVAQPGFVREHEAGKDTYLHYAAQRGTLDMVKMLFGYPVKHASEENKDSPAKQELVAETTACLLALGSNKSTPLAEAIAYGSDDNFAFMMEQLPPGTDLTDSAVLPFAAMYNKLDALKRILDFGDTDIDKHWFYGTTALGLACRHGYLEVVRELLRRGGNAWALDLEGDPPFWWLIHNQADDPSDLPAIAKELLQHSTSPEMLRNMVVLAAGKDYDWMVRLLLDADADKNARDDSQRTPLQRAVESGSESVVRLLLQRQANIELPGSNDATPIISAVRNRHTAIVEMLLDAGAHTGNVGEDGPDNVAYIAAVNGDNSTLKLLFRRGIQLPLSGPGCPLVEVVRQGYASTLELILEKQPEFQGQDVLSECAHVALRKSDVQTLSLLLALKADPSVVSAQRWMGTALNECAYYGNIKMARVLLGQAKVVQPERLAGQYHTPLTAAVSWAYYGHNSPDGPKVERRLKRQLAMINFLIERGDDIQAIGGSFGTMLNAASARGVPALIEYVCRLGLPVTLVDKEGRNAAHSACSFPKFEREKLQKLVELAEEKEPGSASSLLRAPDKQGRKPLHFAAANSCGEAIQYLLEDLKIAKEDVNCEDKDGWTPLHWACCQWDVLVVKALVAANADKNACQARPIDSQTGDSIPVSNWTPWDVAVFYDIANDALAETLGVQNRSTEAKKGLVHNAACDSCHVNIRGIRHKCDDCRDYDLCNKCIRWSKDCHDPEHTFTSIGAVLPQREPILNVNEEYSHSNSDSDNGSVDKSSVY